VSGWSGCAGAHDAEWGDGNVCGPTPDSMGVVIESFDDDRRDETASGTSVDDPLRKKAVRAGYVT